MTGTVPLVTHRQAQDVARQWSEDVRDVTHVRTGENSVWRVVLGGRQYALRITHERHRARPQLQAELEFVSYLATHGLSVARPLSLPSDETLLDASRLLTAADGSSYAAIFEWLDGRPYEYHSSDVDRPLLRRWGETMARLHQLSYGFTPSRGTRADWRDDPVAGCDLRGVTIEPRTTTLRDELVGWLSAMTPDPAHYGMVHGDFERTNFVLQGDEIALFDFDDCCRHWFAWDVACALWVFRNDRPDTRARLLDWFLDGYAAVRAPDHERLADFSKLIRLRTVALLLHHLRRAGAAEPAARDWIARNEAWLQSAWHW